jgi:6-phosphogluconolactonase
MKRSSGTRARVRGPSLAALAAAAAAICLAGCSDDEPSGTGAGAAGSGASSGTGASGAGGNGVGAGASVGVGGSSAGGGGSGGEPVDTHPYVYVGQGNGEIAVFDLDRSTGALTPLSTVDAGNYPSFLAISPDKRFVYAALESSDEIASFSIDPLDAHLTKLGSVTSEGNGPAHVSVDHTGKWVFAANYGSGTVAVIPVNDDGALGLSVDTESPGQNSHLIRVDPSNDFVFVPNKGSDTVAQFLFDDAIGQLEANAPANVVTADGAGPRHLDFHPSLPIVYVINESDDTLSVYDFDTAAGTLSEKQIVSTLPDGEGGGGNTCADVHVSVDGKYVFGSNRGHDSIVVFAADPTDGRLTLVEHEPTGGETPRNFAVDPAGGLLLVANQNSNLIVPMTIDPASGALTALPATTTDDQPYWVGVVALPVQLD